MKIIITEDQYYNLMLKRRFNDIMYEAYMIVKYGDDFYGDIDFCKIFPTFHSLMVDVVDEVIRHYGDMSNFDAREFIYDEIGVEKFIKIILDEYGKEYRSFYKKRTKDCE